MKKERFSILPVLILAFVLTGCAGLVPRDSSGGGSLRVLVMSGVDEVRVEDSRGGDTVVRYVSPRTITVDGRRKSSARFRARGGFVRLAGRSYRGSIEVLPGEGGLMVVDELDVESYLVGVVNSEISSSWHPEAVKAQVVAARTYALYRKAAREGELYHLKGSHLGQAYNGTGGEDTLAERAVQGTRGEIVSYGGSPALTVYHANAGGVTEAASHVWQRDFPYLRSVESPGDELDPRFEWEFSVSADTLGSLLSREGHRVGLPEAVSVEETSPTGRVKVLTVRDSYNHEARLRGEDLRRILGYSRLRSTMFEVSQSGYVFLFTGRGSGHGVGMSQWGAKGMAEEGYSYREILRHYYPGVGIIRAYR